MQEMIYQNKKALKPVQKVLNEAIEALQFQDRITTNDEEISKIMAAINSDSNHREGSLKTAPVGGVIGLGAGLGASFATLYFVGISGFSAVGITSGLATIGGFVGSGMIAGVGLFALPAIILGAGAYAVLNKEDKKQLIVMKQDLLEEAKAQLKDIRASLELATEEQRQEYLNKLGIMLDGIINDLEHDDRLSSNS